jgi:hypothetical protein
MQRISITEPVKIRLREYKTLFRRFSPLEKQEKAILGLIYQNNGDYGFIELGNILGFAISDNPERLVRKDIAEIELFQSYLENLKSKHLIEFNDKSVQLTFWGEKAINDGCKYSFYSGNIQIPEFFDIELSNGVSDFSFNEIGVEIGLTNEQNQNKPWDLGKIDATDNNLINQFLHNRRNKNDEIIIDSIEPLSNPGLIETELEFSESSNLVAVYYQSELHNQLSKEFNGPQNTSKANNLKLKIEFKSLVENKEDFSIEDLTNFISIIDWSDVLKSPKIIWDARSIGILEKFQVNWTIISSMSPIATIEDAIDDYIDKFDWIELTNRLHLNFILSNIDYYPWDVDVLTDRITVEDFKSHVSKIVKLPGIDLDKFYKQVDKEFIKQNFDQLPRITRFLLINESNALLEYLLEFSYALWDKTLVSQKLSLNEIEANFTALKQNLNFETLIDRFISVGYDSNAGIFAEAISLASFSEGQKILNRFSKCNLGVSKLQILDNHELIYWGNDVVPGFELNHFQNWSIDILRRFEEKWGYSEAIRFLGENISDSKIIEEFNFEWDFDSISKNLRLVNQENFFEKNKNKLDINSVIHVFDKNTLKSNLRSLFLLDKERKLEDLPVVISRLFDLDDVLETNAEFADLFLSVSNNIDWKQIWSKTQKSFVKENIEKIFYLFEIVPSFNSLLPEITNCFELEYIFETPNWGWDWNSVTKRAIEKGWVVDEVLEAFSGYWDWIVLLEKYFDPIDLQIDRRLFEIAVFLAQAPEEVRAKSWKHITDRYPSHALFSAINSTHYIDLFRWDWNSISSSNKISLELNSLKKFKDRINWSLLSSNFYLNDFFRDDREIYRTRKQWETHVLSYLSDFEELWDFKELSKLDNITRSETIVYHFRQKWDWDILSSENSKLLTIKNKDGVLFNERLFQKFERFINFKVISNRKDALLDFEILNKFNHKNWDWGALSSNKSLKIEKETLLNDLIEKPWDWKILSKNPAISFSNRDLLLLRDKELDWSHFSTKEWVDNATILELAGKAWDWYAISSSSQFIFDQNLLQILSNKVVVNWRNVLTSKNLHCNEMTIGIIASCIKDSQEYWSTLSNNQNLSFENEILLDNYKEFWNWNILIQSQKIDVNSELILKNYKNHINWTTLSSDPNFSPSFSVLFEFKDLLDWRYVSSKIPLSDEILEKFISYIDWKILSSHVDLSGQLPLIKKYIEFWDINAIESNPTVEHESLLYIARHLNSNIKAKFIYSIKKNKNRWAGFAYHFTHIDNAVQIIKEGKIKCRKTAGQLSDSAGNVVWSNTLPHNYARFYFRPHTQTQFYNEFLGVDEDNGYRNKEGDWHSFYDIEYSMLGFPKCPIPIYFVFSLKDVLDNGNNLVQISAGNMQRRTTNFGPIEDMYCQFNFNDLFIYPKYEKEDWRKYRNYAQQELLIENEFEFSNLNNFQIFCHNEQHRQLLINLIGISDNKLTYKIKVDSSLFRNENPDIRITNFRGAFSLRTKRKAKGYFEIIFSDSADIVGLEGDLIDYLENGVRFKSHINFPVPDKAVYFSIFFIDECKTKWFVHANCKFDKCLLDPLKNSDRLDPHQISSKERIAEHLW